MLSLAKFSLKDKIAIVTGSGTGIGKGIALSFAQAGANVVVAEINPAKAEETATEIRKLGRQALAVVTDVTNSSQIVNMVDATLGQFGRIDILVNNAGGQKGPIPAIWVSEEEWNRLLTLNLTSVYLCCKLVAPVMMKQGVGNIINISSGAAQKSAPGLNAYAVAKAGVINFGLLLSRELAEYHVRVNTISPSAIETERTIGIKGPGRERAANAGIPLGRIGTPDDIAGAAIYLASDASEWVTGIVIDVWGGPITRKGDWESFKARFPDLLQKPAK